MAVYHNYIVVVGRVPFDDEDTLCTYEHMTVEQAHQAFEEEMYSGEPEGDREYHIEQYDCAVFINHTLTSQTPITAS